MLFAALIALLAACGSAGAYTIPGLAAAFSEPTAYANHPVTFDGSASSAAAGETIASYEWTFGDGSTATTSTPTVTHTYTAAGHYAVTLVVADPSGNTSQPAAHTLHVHSDAPKAKFSVHPKQAGVGHTVTFDGSASSDPDGDAVVSYEWNFGDGSRLTTSTPIAQHVYALPAAYIASLTVLEARGEASASVAHTVTVVTPTGPPIARFTVTPPRPIATQPARFDASGSSASAGRTIVAYEWDFGDGTKTVTATPVTGHTYDQPQDYVATLVVVDNHGRHSEKVVRLIRVRSTVRLFRVRVRRCRRGHRGCGRGGLAVRFVLTHADRVVLAIRRHRRILTGRVVFAHRGHNRFVVRFRGARNRRYALVLAPEGGRTVSVRFRWRR